MKKFRTVGGALIGGLVVMVFTCRMIASRIAIQQEKNRNAFWEFQHGPFGVLVSPSSSQPYVRPDEFHLDMQNLTVSGDADNSDEKQVLARMEKELRTTNAPVIEVRWTRVAKERPSETRDLLYGRDALQLDYRIASRSPLHADKVTAMDFMGISHAATTDIARDIGTISRRK